MPIPVPHRAAWSAIILLPLVAVALVILPLWLDQPFAVQTPDALAAVFHLRAWAPALTLLAALVTLLAAVSLWPGRRLLGRVLLVALVGVASGAAWLARQNVFEWMFNPVRSARYASLEEAAAFVGQDDMLLVVALNGETAAYPVRLMAYHHLLQDVVGGVPIVVTY
jgi:hypothetical protein